VAENEFLVPNFFSVEANAELRQIVADIDRHCRALIRNA
jgi:hypothetical protein